MDAWIPIAIALLAGGAVAALVWSASRRVVALPAEDRTWRDRPPLGFRLMWWPIQWIAHELGPLLPSGHRARVLGQLRLAGLDYSLSPAQFIAARLLLALVSWVVGAFVLATLVGLSTLHALPAALLGWIFPAVWVRDRIAARRHRTLQGLPFMLDMMTLCVEAGLNLGGAMQQAVAKGPAGPLRDELARVLNDVRAGKPRAQALRQLADRMDEPSIHNLVSTLIQAENTGMDLGPVLRAQAEQRRTERFVRAEKLAMQAPVKMLLPLVAFIFPCTFVVIFFPIAMKFLALGL